MRLPLKPACERVGEGRKGLAPLTLETDVRGELVIAVERRDHTGLDRSRRVLEAALRSAGDIEPRSDRSSQKADLAALRDPRLGCSADRGPELRRVLLDLARSYVASDRHDDFGLVELVRRRHPLRV